MLPNLMGRKWLVNQSFHSKKNLTTSGIPYIATAPGRMAGHSLIAQSEKLIAKRIEARKLEATRFLNLQACPLTSLPAMSYQLHAMS